MTAVWELPDLPFIVRPLESPHNSAGIPDRMSFRLGIDERTGRLVQLSSPELEEILARAYSEGSMITGMLDEGGLGQQYAEDFLAFVADVMDLRSLEGRRVLEVGCGTGYLLHRFQQLDAQVYGVEPGPHAEEGAQRYGVPVERGFFPDVGGGQTYDIVVLYCVLEHLPDPLALLKEVNKAVAPGGTVLVAVPDEEPYIRLGEVSLLFHEHFSYFTGRTLQRTIQAAGAGPVTVARSDFSNLLLAAYRPGDACEPMSFDTAADVSLASEFRGRAMSMVAAVWQQIDVAVNHGEEIGLYVPSRAANIIAMRPQVPDGVRFFDDNEALTGSYFPGIPIPVEGRAGLLARPTQHLVVMSLSFGERILASLGSVLPKDVQALSLEQLLRQVDADWHS